MRLANAPRLFPERGTRTRPLHPHHDALLRHGARAIQGRSTPRTGPLQLWQLGWSQRLGATDAYTEYRAENIFAGASAGAVLLRVYKADPYLPAPKSAPINAFASPTPTGP